MATGIYLWECIPTKNKHIGQSENLRKDFVGFIRFNEPYGEDDRLNEERKVYPSLECWKYTVLEKCDIGSLDEKQKKWQEKYELEKEDDLIQTHTRNIKEWYNNSLDKEGMRLLYEMIRNEEAKKLIKLDGNRPLMSMVDVSITGKLADRYKLHDWEVRSKIFSGLTSAYSKVNVNPTFISCIAIARGTAYYSATNELQFTINKMIYDLIMSEEII